MSCNRNDKENGDWFPWVAIVVLFGIGLWPVALIVLFSKLFGSDSGHKRSTPSAPPLTVQTGSTGAHTAPRQENRAEQAARKMTKSPVVKKSNARALKIAGVLVALSGLYLALDPADMVFAGYVQNFIWDMLKYLSVAAAGFGMFLSGLSMDRSMRRYAQYLAVIGDRQAIPFSQLSKTMGYSEKKVAKDLQKMIEKGYFGGQAYLNMELGYFFRNSQADAEFEKKQETAQAQPPKEAEEGYSGILRSIRAANDRIADPVLSQKIDRLEEITAKIFRAVEEDPKKRSRIDTFLNYYLPTTQKLLNSYAEFEATGIEGENLRSAKERIEKTMDSIIAGFEHQLDELYKADAMDVDSDIRVMETMLNRDTASVEKDFGLGTAPAAPSAVNAGKTVGTVDLGATAAQTEEKGE